jgi:ribosome-binding factor A
MRKVMARKKHPQRGGDAPGGGSQRQLRVGELIRHAIAELLTRGDIHDDVIASHLVTVPEVKMTADLRLATVYLMPLGGKDAQAVLAAFEKKQGCTSGAGRFREEQEIRAPGSCASRQHEVCA